MMGPQATAPAMEVPPRLQLQEALTILYHLFFVSVGFATLLASSLDRFDIGSNLCHVFVLLVQIRPRMRIDDFKYARADLTSPTATHFNTSASATASSPIPAAYTAMLKASAAPSATNMLPPKAFPSATPSPTGSSTLRGSATVSASPHSASHRGAPTATVPSSALGTAAAPAACPSALNAPFSHTTATISSTMPVVAGTAGGPLGISDTGTFMGCGTTTSMHATPPTTAPPSTASPTFTLSTTACAAAGLGRVVSCGSMASSSGASKGAIGATHCTMWPSPCPSAAPSPNASLRHPTALLPTNPAAAIFKGCEGEVPLPPLLPLLQATATNATVPTADRGGTCFCPTARGAQYSWLRGGGGGKKRKPEADVPVLTITSPEGLYFRLKCPPSMLDATLLKVLNGVEGRLLDRNNREVLRTTTLRTLVVDGNMQLHIGTPPDAPPSAAASAPAPSMASNSRKVARVGGALSAPAAGAAAAAAGHASPAPAARAGAAAPGQMQQFRNFNPYHKYTSEELEIMLLSDDEAVAAVSAAEAREAATNVGYFVHDNNYYVDPHNNNVLDGTVVLETGMHMLAQTAQGAVVHTLRCGPTALFHAFNALRGGGGAIHDAAPFLEDIRGYLHTEPGLDHLTEALLLHLAENDIALEHVFPDRDFNDEPFEAENRADLLAYRDYMLRDGTQWGAPEMMLAALRHNAEIRVVTDDMQVTFNGDNIGQQQQQRQIVHIRWLAHGHYVPIVPLAYATANGRQIQEWQNGLNAQWEMDNGGEDEDYFDSGAEEDEEDAEGEEEEEDAEGEEVEENLGGGGSGNGRGSCRGGVGGCSSGSGSCTASGCGRGSGSGSGGGNGSGGSGGSIRPPSSSDPEEDAAIGLHEEAFASPPLRGPLNWSPVLHTPRGAPSFFLPRFITDTFVNGAPPPLNNPLPGAVDPVPAPPTAASTLADPVLEPGGYYAALLAAATHLDPLIIEALQHFAGREGGAAGGGGGGGAAAAAAAPPPPPPRGARARFCASGKGALPHSHNHGPRGAHHARVHGRL